MDAKRFLDRRAELDKLIKKMEKEKAEIDQKIKMEMQDATIAREADYKIFLITTNYKRL